MPSIPSLTLSPHGHLLLLQSGGDEPSPDPASLRRIEKAFEAGPVAGLLHLGAVEVATPLPPVFGFWRDFSRSFFTSLCGLAELEALRDKVELPAPTAELSQRVASAPPMTGGEYLSVAVLEAMWGELLASFRAVLRASSDSVQSILAAKNPAWNGVGRVHLHLAENKRNPEQPFAFLAAYTSGLSSQGKAQHRPLGEAVRESSSAKDKGRLLALLLPVQKAAAKSALLKELVELGALFQPQGWTPGEAYRFLQAVPALEESGVVVRVPDWWKARRPPRPQVSVSIGTGEPSTLGLDALLDFSAALTVDGEPVSEDELRALRSSAAGLTLLKGKWVEVDRQKLDQVLAHWKAVQRQAEDGISFIEGMRLLAGAGIADVGEEAEVVEEGSRVQAGPWLAQTLAALRGEDGSEGVEGAGLRAELRPYQRQGVRWLAFLSRLRLGACLADDMGLGKTVQVLALLLFLKQKRALPGPHLLVVPASLIANWKGEAERFAPSLRLLVAHSSELEPKSLAALPERSVSEADVVVTSYGTVHRLPWMAERRWGLVVLDEAQAIKNPGVKQSRSVKALKSEARIALTGTPVENRLSDLWSLFDFLNPGLLGSAKDFGRFLKGAKSYGPLRALTRPYILRRLKTDRSVIADLPDKTELRAFCGLSPRQAALYGEAVESLAREIQAVDGMKRRGLVLSYLTRFKQLCNHPSQWLGDGRFDPADSGKFARLRELCEVVASRQEKALVFSQFAQMAGPLASWLAVIFGRPGLVLTGDTPVKQRQERVRQFQEDEQVPFFVLSLKAGGTGLNLTAASHVIHFDRWWNPAVENQATDRAFRIGQKRNVLVHKLVCRGTIEERVDALLDSKQGLARDLLEGGEELKLTELDDRQLLSLVSLDLHSARAEGQEGVMFYGGFPEYVSVAQRRAQAKRLIPQLRARGEQVSPVVIEGRNLANTFWGKAWCQNLEAYSDFESRLPRGRSYVRNGAVVDLQISLGSISAKVNGSSLYDVEVKIERLAEDRWKSLSEECAGEIDSVVELLSGRLSSAVMERLCHRERGLFPSNEEVTLSCSCPDGAWLCKHLAAVLYGIGARLDREPELLFVLRGVDVQDLIAHAGSGKLLGAQVKSALGGESLSDLFGIELDPGAAAPVAPRSPPTREKARGSRGGAVKKVGSSAIATSVPPAEGGRAGRAAKEKSKPTAKAGSVRQAPKRPTQRRRALAPTPRSNAAKAASTQTLEGRRVRRSSPPASSLVDVALSAALKALSAGLRPRGR